jgi:hypothetical protein
LSADKSPKRFGPATSLHALVLAEYNAFFLLESLRFTRAIDSLVTLDLIKSGGPSSDVLRFICLFPNLDNLSVAKHSERGTDPALAHGTSPGFRGVLTLEHTNCLGKYGFVQRFLKVTGGLRFQGLDLRCNAGTGPPVSV